MTEKLDKKDLILQGRLPGIEFPDLLTIIGLIRKRGCLVLRQGETEREIYWNNGEVVFASSNSPEHSLGNFLVRNGKISQQQYEESMKHMTADTRHGKLLVQLGFISPKDLWWGVKNQVMEIIYALFTWNEGEFFFYDTEHDLGEKITLSINTSSLIMEGVRRLDELPRIKERITSLNTVYAKIPGAEPRIEELDLSDSEREVFDLIDSNRSIRDLINLTNLPEFETTHILYQLLTARLVDAVPEIKESRPVFLDVEDSPELLQLISTYNGMFERLFGTLQEAVGERESRDIYATALDGSGSDDLWAGVFFDQFGRFDENMLIANISELPFERRKVVLDEGLNTLLSVQLFEVSQHLDPARKVVVFKYISDQKAQLEVTGQ